MNRIIFFIILFVSIVFASSAQEYNLTINGIAKNGDYLVNVTAILDKKQYKEANDYLKKLAVEGVMLRGVAGSNAFSAQKPLISDPTVKQTKAEFFTAFNNEKLYQNYATINPSSVVSTQLPKKKYEVRAIVTVRKEDLLHFLQDSGIVKGMSNLW